MWRNTLDIDMLFILLEGEEPQNSHIMGFVAGGVFDYSQYPAPSEHFYLGTLKFQSNSWVL